MFLQSQGAEIGDDVLTAIVTGGMEFGGVVYILIRRWRQARMTGR